MTDFDHNPALYRKLSYPFPSMDAVRTAVSEFYAGVRALREKFGLPDVLVLLEANVTTGPGSVDRSPPGEDRVTSLLHLGSSLRVLPMLAGALGRERAAINQAVDQLATQSAADLAAEPPLPGGGDGVENPDGGEPPPPAAPPSGAGAPKPAAGKRRGRPRKTPGVG